MVGLLKETEQVVVEQAIQTLSGNATKVQIDTPEEALDWLLWLTGSTQKTQVVNLATYVLNSIVCDALRT